jgi:hypothetical protein
MLASCILKITQQLQTKISSIYHTISSCKDTDACSVHIGTGYALIRDRWQTASKTVCCKLKYQVSPCDSSLSINIALAAAAARLHASPLLNALPSLHRRNVPVTAAAALAHTLPGIDRR